MTFSLQYISAKRGWISVNIILIFFADYTLYISMYIILVVAVLGVVIIALHKFG